jgi:hypothetical protein
LKEGRVAARLGEGEPVRPEACEPYL